VAPPTAATPHEAQAGCRPERLALNPAHRTRWASLGARWPNYAVIARAEIVVPFSVARRGDNEHLVNRASVVSQAREPRVGEYAAAAPRRSFSPTGDIRARQEASLHVRARRSRVTGAKDRRLARDQLLADARRRRFDVLVCWRLDRLGRNLKHLITCLTTCRRWGSRSCLWPRESTRPRPPASCRRAAQGKPLGRPRQPIGERDLTSTTGLSTRKAAALLGVSHVAVHRARTVSKNPRGRPHGLRLKPPPPA
jgi:hypothetical protein